MEGQLRNLFRVRIRPKPDLFSLGCRSRHDYFKRDYFNSIGAKRSKRLG
jgi:hypothetical protein